MQVLLDHTYLQAAILMKTRLILLVGFVICALSVLGQSTSAPLQVELTLSAGRYPEAFANDSLHRIGQFGYNTVSGRAYRLEVQGQKKDDEVHGATGTSYNYEFRMHDPRIGRILSIDPLAAQYPWNSPYAFSENRVIDAVELEGLEAVRLADQEMKNGTLTILKVPGAFAVAHNYQNTTTASAVTQQGPNQTTVSESFWAKAGLWWDGKAPFLTATRNIFNHTSNPQSPYNWAVRQFQTMPTNSNGTQTRAYWGNVNVYTHVVGQAFAAALFGSDKARFVGDMHERIPAEAAKFNGDMNTAGWGIEFDGARDLINNEYGRALGVQIMADWQAQNCGPLDEGFSAFFLNRAHDYLINTFPDMGKYLNSDYPNDDANLAGFTARWQQAYCAYQNGEW